MATNIDGIMGTLGNPGKAQCGLLFLVNLNLLAMYLHHLSMVFIGSTPPHHCKVSDEFPLNATIPFDKNIPNECSMFIDPTNHSLGTTECTNGWTYLYERGEWNVVGEFNLVCNSRYLVGLASTIYFCGTIVGALIFGDLSDRIGRKPVYLVTVCAHSLIGVGQYFANAYGVFVALRFIHGILIQGIVISGYCLSMELFYTKWRTESSLFTSCMIAAGEFLLVFLAYFNPNWRHFYLASTLPSMATIIYIWILPESLRWLLVNKKTDKAINVCKLFARINKIQLKPDFSENIIAYCGSSQPQQHYDIRNLFSSASIRKTSLIVIYLWFAKSIVMLGVSFTFSSLHGDKYANFAIGVALGYVGRVVAYPSLKRLGRRVTTSISFLVGGLACVAAAIISIYWQGAVAQSLITWLIILAKAAAACNFMCIGLQTQEVFPTVLRSTAMGLGGVSGRIASLIAPYVELLGAYTYAAIPDIVIGAVSLVAAFAETLMPETYLTPLPDSIDDAKQINVLSNLNSKDQPEDKQNLPISIVSKCHSLDGSAEEINHFHNEPGLTMEQNKEESQISPSVSTLRLQDK